MADFRNPPPWQQGILAEWAIVGMNHYHMNGERRLFVAMTKCGHCIVEEGADDEYLWNRLWHKADTLTSGVQEAGKKVVSQSDADERDQDATK